jgi:hypothetical protein
MKVSPFKSPLGQANVINGVTPMDKIEEEKERINEMISSSIDQ